MLALNRNGQAEGVTMMIDMMRDLERNGRDSRFVKKLQGLPLWELKSRTRGGAKGGARVYFAFMPPDEVLLLNAEIKASGKPSEAKIFEAVTILKAFKDGKSVVRRAT